MGREDALVRYLDHDHYTNIGNKGSNANTTFLFFLGRKLAELELRTLITLVVLSFALEETPAALSGYHAHDIITHIPWQCYVKLTELA